jgi:hypothetical protein
MFDTRSMMTRALAAGAAFGVAIFARPLHAQDGGNGFLFGAPLGSVSIRGGYAVPRAGSDLFSFVQQQLTVSKSDFNAPTFAADVAIRLTPRFDLVLGSGYAGSSTASEFRKYVDNNDQPIQQTTTFRRVPLTASLRLNLVPEGRSIGRFAWIPSTLVPYVGAGGGAMWYSFGQTGDFVDYQTLNVYNDEFHSSGWTAMAHAFAGVEYSLTPRFALTGEGRYTWASAPLSSDFSGFQRLDLSGAMVTAGLSIRF